MKLAALAGFFEIHRAFGKQIQITRGGLWQTFSMRVVNKSARTNSASVRFPPLKRIAATTAPMQTMLGKRKSSATVNTLRAR